MNRSRTLSAVAVACAVAFTASCATTQQPVAPVAIAWQSVAKTDAQEAFVDDGSVQSVGGMLEASVKQDFAQPQPAAKEGRSYLSTRTLYRFDCAQRRIAMKDVRAFAGSDLQGETVQKATSTDKGLQWLDAPAATVFGELLDHVCKGAPGR
jgi:hypothetical protein